MDKWKQYPITIMMLLLCVGVYLYMLLRYGTTEDAYAILEMGGKFTPLIIEENQWWRLITAGFIHIGLSHILMNGISLYFLGQELESAIGSLRFFIIYMCAVMGGNLLSFAFNIDNISAGASTGVFGLFAAIIALSKLYPDSSMLKERAHSFIFLIIFNLLSGIMSPGLDNLGHMGGALFGLLAMLSIGTKGSKLKLWQQVLIWGIMLLLTMVLGYYGIQHYHQFIGGMYHG